MALPYSSMVSSEDEENLPNDESLHLRLNQSSDDENGRKRQRTEARTGAYGGPDDLPGDCSELDDTCGILRMITSTPNSRSSVCSSTSTSRLYMSTEDCSPSSSRTSTPTMSRPATPGLSAEDSRSNTPTSSRVFRPGPLRDVQLLNRSITAIDDQQERHTGLVDKVRQIMKVIFIVSLNI